MGFELLALLGLGLGLVAIGGATSTGKPYQRRRPLAGRRRRRRPGVGLAQTFETGEAMAMVGEEQTQTMILGDIPDGRVAYVVDVEAEGADVNARGRFRANVNTGPDGVSTIVFGGIMPPDRSRMLGLSEYLVDATRGTVGMVGFSFYGSDALTFNVASVKDSGPYRVAITWRGIER